MKFSTRYILMLFILLVLLGIFLHSLNVMTKKHEREEKESKKHKKEGFNSFNTDVFNLRNGNEPPPTCPNLLINKGDILLLYNTLAIGPENQLIQTFKSMDEYQAYVSQQQSEGKNCPLLYLRQEVNTQGQDVYRMYTEVTMGPGAFPPPGGVGLIPSHMIPSPEPMPTLSDPYMRPSPGAQEFGQQGRPPLPPPFLESVPIWDLHHQPPLYIEGGMPALPMETRSNEVIHAMDATKDTDPKFNQTGLNSFDPYGLYVGRFTDVDVLQKKTADTGNGLSANAADPNWGGVTYTQDQIQRGEFSNSQVQRVIYPQMGFV